MKAALKIARRCPTASGICEALREKIEHLHELDNTTIVAVRFVHASDNGGDASDSGSN